MSKNQTVARILKDLDEAEIDALNEMVREDPELLRQALKEYGYLEEEDADGGRFLTNSRSTPLPEAKQALLEHLEEELDPPQSVAEIKALVGDEGAEFREQYSSAQYRTWLSSHLKELAESGEIGRFRDGRTVYYAESPALAVRHWARLNERFPQELTVADSAEINDDTGMPIRVISDAIRTITND